MIINFIAAILIAHLADPYPAKFPALMMLAGACFLFLHGPGELSVDRLLAKRAKKLTRAASPETRRFPSSYILFEVFF